MSRAALETGFPGLDLIRFGAALMVALYHFMLVGPLRLGPDGSAFLAAFAPLRPLVSAFWVAVPVFFVLSGVVIAFSAEGRGAAAFVRRRALRLYPAALICATVTLAVWPKDDAAWRYLRSIALWPAGPWVSDVYWTMAVEVTFYAMVALALAIGGDRWVTRLGAALAVLSFGWWGLRVANLAAAGMFEPAIAYGKVLDPFLLLGHGGFFALGILLYALAARGFSAGLGALAALAALAGLASVFAMSRGAFAASGEGGLRMLIAPALWTVAVAAIVVAIARARPGGGRWPKAVRQVGLATYPLYLVHAELGIVFMLLLAPLGPWPAMLLALAGVLAAVALIMRAEAWLRRPFLRSGGARA